MITLAKAEYLKVDVTRYYVSVNGNPMKEISHDSYSRYLKQSSVKNVEVESFDDRTMIFHEIQPDQ